MDLKETIESLLTTPAAEEDVLRVLYDAMHERLDEQLHEEAVEADDLPMFEWAALDLIARAIRVLRTGMTEDELMEKGSTLLVAWDKETQ